MSEIIQIHPLNPQERNISKVVDCLSNGGLIIYPTDTVYGIGCDLYNSKAIQRLCRVKGVDPKKMHLSFMCHDLSDLSLYAHQVSTPTFKLMKKALPGAFTFILKASNKVPKILSTKKKQVGIRVPSHQIPLTLVERLGNPIITSSVKSKDEILQYMTDPELIFEEYKHEVDMVIDGGIGGNEPSTVINALDDVIEIVRQGAGDTTWI
jgi:tRNA threonylcarbamoyl adenosine modification protein (Sua5/YciO/YrdC/YwlC family)